MLVEIFILALIALYVFNWWAHGYWKRRNVFSVPTEFFFGNVRLLLQQKIVMYALFCSFYKKYKQHKMVGFYSFYRPILLVMDPEIIKRILVTDFNCFSNTGFDIPISVDPIMGMNPFTIKSIPEWKEIRGIQAAHQTQVKLRELVPGFIKASGMMFEFIKNQKTQPIKVLDLATRIAVDFSVISAFGIEPRSFTDPDYCFLKHASSEKVFSSSNINTFAAFLHPFLCKLLSLRFVLKEAEDFFVSMARSNLEHRISTNITRNDLFDTIIKSQRKKDGQSNKVSRQGELVMAAHCATFYADATISASNVLSFLMLELAIHQVIQEKLREEIFSVGKNPEDFDFDKINSMTYLQMVFDEKNNINFYRWKEIRGIQAAHQTQVKLRELVPGFIKASGMMFEFIKNQKTQPIKVLDLATRIAVDFSVISAFGIEPRSFTDPDYCFLKHASSEKVFSSSNINTFAAFLHPFLCKLLSLRFVLKEAEDFFVSMARSNLEHRISTNITRNDLFDTIIKSQRKKDGQSNKVSRQGELVMAAHCATFYADATISASNVLSFLMLELAIHQVIQEKLREEIFSVGKNPEDFDFDKINSMTYLQMVFDESMRLHSPVPSLSRSCTKDTIIDGVKISKGTKVFISALALHQDPEYYPEPMNFDPERFSEANKQSRIKYTYLPFGEGPRICVGFKYGTLLVKTSIIFFLLKYRLLASDNAKESLHDPYEFFLCPRADATIKFQELSF